ncbi:uncharacterized protein C8Q71DRAFT_179604 [Rhodofomes roseus]|uniref:Uncharacterized protein n=1 Tax=Rhodofomes roseus TaxID=34475 RepID=A0ABQ8K995_9APHY|nr:uncharacterized protein C8Q71DRAFT_179604 [Rhodofomes roseus]KAH9833882.1 hypothetical protein C8Q71DRAFT_179604 [Rhodofomes roseus]
MRMRHVHPATRDSSTRARSNERPAQISVGGVVPLRLRAPSPHHPMQPSLRGLLSRQLYPDSGPFTAAVCRRCVQAAGDRHHYAMASTVRRRTCAGAGLDTRRATRERRGDTMQRGACLPMRAARSKAGGLRSRPVCAEGSSPPWHRTGRSKEAIECLASLLLNEASVSASETHLPLCGRGSGFKCSPAGDPAAIDWGCMHIHASIVIAARAAGKGLSFA